MALWFAAVAAGLVLGALTGGSPRRLHQVRVRLAAMGASAMLVLGLVRVGLLNDGGALLAVALLGLVVCSVANLHLPGTGIVAVGLTPNVAAVLLNGGTPVEARALSAVGADPATIELAPTQHLAGPDTLAPWLASTIPVPGVGLVVSFGDLIIATGLVVLIARAMAPASRQGIPVQEILDSGPLTLADQPSKPDIDLTTTPPTQARTRRRRERPVDVVPGTAQAVPIGWGSTDHEPGPSGSRLARSDAHPTMRLVQR